MSTPYTTLISANDLQDLIASGTPLMVYLADRQRQVPEVGAEVTLAWDAAHLNLFSPQHANPTMEVH